MQPFIDQGQVDHVSALMGLPFSPRRKKYNIKPC
jgi:hypothetical protein